MTQEKLPGAANRLLMRCAALLLVSAALLSGCARREAEVVEIGYMAWGSAEQLAVEQKIIDEFEKTHPNVRVKLFMVPSSSYHQKLQIMLASRTAPDVVRVDHYYFPAIVKKDYFLCLEPFVRADPEFDRDDFFPFALEEGTYEGRLYGLNMLGGGHIIYYNKKLFDEAGIPYPYDLYRRGEWTMDKFVEVARKLTKKDSNGRYVQFGSNMPMPWYPVWAFGGDFLSPDYKRCLLGTPEAVRGLQWMKDLRWKHHVVPTPAEAAMSAFTFESGKLGMMFAWSGQSPVLWRAARGFDWDIAPVPEGPAGRFTCLKGNQLAIYKESKHPKEAWEFIRHVTSRETEMYVCGELRRSLTMHKSLASDPRYLKSDGPPRNTRVLVEPLEYGKLIPINERYHAWYVELQAGLERMWTDESDAAEMVEWMVPRINSALSEEDW